MCQQAQLNDEFMRTDHSKHFVVPGQQTAKNKKVRLMPENIGVLGRVSLFL